MQKKKKLRVRTCGQAHCVKNAMKTFQINFFIYTSKIQSHRRTVVCTVSSRQALLGNPTKIPYSLLFSFFFLFFYRNYMYTFFTLQMLRRKKFVFYPFCTQIRKQMRKYLHTNKTILHEQQAENSRVYVHFYSLIPHRRQIYWSD